MKSIILDTDIDTDCDDTGALAILHGLAKQRECSLLGIVCSVPIAGAAHAVSAINRWYGRDDLPIGLVHVPDYEQAERWGMYRGHRERFVTGQFGIRPYHQCLTAMAPAPRAEDAVSLYRRLLTQSADRSVTICAIGTLTALAQLLASGPDEHCPLAGAALVQQKVAELVSMAVVAHPEGQEEFNWRMDMESAAQVVQRWPTPLTISGKGHTIMTGARFMAAAPAGHPVREAYATCLGGLDRDRPSWDLIAVLYAVRGLAAPFSISPDYGLLLDAATRKHVWRPATNASPRRYLTPTLPDDAMARELDELMIASLACSRGDD